MVLQLNFRLNKPLLYLLYFLDYLHIQNRIHHKQKVRYIWSNYLRITYNDSYYSNNIYHNIDCIYLHQMHCIICSFHGIFNIFKLMNLPKNLLDNFLHSYLYQLNKIHFYKFNIYSSYHNSYN